MIVKLLVDVYGPEPWSRRVVCFRAGQIVNAIPADNMPEGHAIKLWIEENDPRTDEPNVYGFDLGVGEYEVIEE